MTLAWHKLLSTLEAATNAIANLGSYDIFHHASHCLKLPTTACLYLLPQLSLNRSPHSSTTQPSAVPNMGDTHKFTDRQWTCPPGLESATFDGSGHAGGGSKGGIIKLVAEGKDIKIARAFFTTTPSRFKDAYAMNQKPRLAEINNTIGRMKDCKHGALLAFTYYLSKGHLSLRFVETNSTITGPELAVACAELSDTINAPRFLSLVKLEFRNIWLDQRLTVDQIRLLMSPGNAFHRFLYDWTMTDADEHKRHTYDLAELQIPSYSRLIFGEWHKRCPHARNWLYRPPPEAASIDGDASNADEDEQTAEEQIVVEAGGTSEAGRGMSEQGEGSGGQTTQDPSAQNTIDTDDNEGVHHSYFDDAFGHGGLPANDLLSDPCFDSLFQ